MRRILITALASLLATIGLTTLVAPAAHADGGSASVSGRDGVRWDGCRYYTYTYTINVDPFASDWDAQVTLYDPHGNESDSDYLTASINASTGTSTFYVCGGEPAGWYQIEMQVSFYDDYYNPIGSASASDKWLLRAPRSRTSLSVSDLTPHYGQRIRFRIGSTVENPGGYFANDYEYVILQARRSGVWVKIKGSRTLTNEYGVVRLSARWLRHRPLTIRAVTLSTSDFTGSYSAAKRIG